MKYHKVSDTRTRWCYEANSSRSYRNAVNKFRHNSWVYFTQKQQVCNRCFSNIGSCLFPIFHTRSRLQITILFAGLLVEWSKLLPFDRCDLRTCWVSFVVNLNNRARDGYCFRTVGDWEGTRGLDTSDVLLLISRFAHFRLSN